MNPYDLEIEKLKEELSDAYEELRKIRPYIPFMFDRTVWDRACNPEDSEEK